MPTAEKLKNKAAVLASREVYASGVWGSEIIGVPAMFMALGIFLLYAGKYLFEVVFGQNISGTILVVLSLMLFIFAIYVIYLFIVQLIRDRKVLWNYTLNHFRMGTWVAGVNILASVLTPIAISAARLFYGIGCFLWVLYLIWLVKMVFKGDLKGGNVNGTVFLSTVATQSVVVAFMRVWPDHVTDFIYWLITLNVVGIIFYWIAFGLVWVVGGIVGPLVDWMPQNNITHGALSITMLAAQMIEDNMPGTLPYFHYVIQAAWVITAVFFIWFLLYEVYLLVSKKKQLLTFYLGNYARNFTYGMFFACSYYGYTYSHSSVMKDVLNPALLLLLAIVVLGVNVWELTHQISSSLFQRVIVHKSV